MTELKELARKLQVDETLIETFNAENSDELAKALESKISSKLAEAQEKIEKVKKDQFGAGAKKTHEAYRALLEEEFGVYVPDIPKTLEGIEAARHYFTKTKGLIDEKSNSDENFKKMKLEAEKFKNEAEQTALQTKKLVEASQTPLMQKIAELELARQRDRIIYEANPIIDALKDKFTMPLSQEVIKNRFADVRDKVALLSVKEMQDGVKYIVDNEGNLVKDGLLGSPITFEKKIESLIASNFDVKLSNGTSTTPAAQDPQRPQQQQAATVGEPKTAEDYLKFISNKDHPVKDRMEYMNKYAAKFG